MNAEDSSSSFLKGPEQKVICNDSKLYITTNRETIENEITEKQSATWTISATSLLLKLYESNLQSLETAKKKKKIWQAISGALKSYNINVSPDQVRWKINALTKKYKRCIESGSSCKFKYFKVMEQIYLKYNINSCTSYSISELLDSKTDAPKYPSSSSMKTESKAVIELRKIRLANRLEADRAQTKIQIEGQWLEYLNRQEESRQQRDQIIERHMKLKEQKLEIRKREIELEQSIEFQNIQLIEKDLTNFLQTEREKCDLLKLFN